MKYVVFAIIIVVCCAKIIIKTYPAGKYVLAPQDYQYAPEIIVDIHGAGGGGDNNYGSGGGSGAYIKASIITLNRTFYVYVGTGGTACNKIAGSGYVTPTQDGDNSYIVSADGIIELIAGGGKSKSYGDCGSKICRCNYRQDPTYGTVQSMNTTGEILIQKNGMNGNIMIEGKDTYYYSNSGLFIGNFLGLSICGGMGGSAPYGAPGGAGYCQSKSFPDPRGSGMNGLIPGGGGGGMGSTDPIPDIYRSNMMILPVGGNGGNGEVTIYY
jgi:hypothetical protein